MIGRFSLLCLCFFKEVWDWNCGCVCVVLVLLSAEEVLMVLRGSLREWRALIWRLLMLCILESFSARWIGLLRVTLNSTNDTLERRSSTLRCVITAECSVTGRHTMKSPCRRRAHAKYPECMASVEKRLHDVVVRAGRDFRFIDKLKWHVLPQFYYYYLFFINFFYFFFKSRFWIKILGNIMIRHVDDPPERKNARLRDASWASFNLSGTFLERRFMQTCPSEARLHWKTMVKQKLLLYVW